MTYQLTTMDNGLRVASETMSNVESVALTVTVGVGARHEHTEQNGISHLLEHMAFKGTKTRSARDIAEAFDNIGGQLNAYTSMENTVYYAKVLKNDANVAADILGDILQNSIFEPEELVREQNVIIQEIAMHHDTPDDLINDYFDEKAFPDQPMGRSILSTPERIASYTRDHLVDYMHTHYQPKQMVLSAAGHITHEQLVGLAERYFSFAPSKECPAPEAARYKGGDVRIESDLEQLHLLLGLPTVNIHSPDYQVLQIYANILGGGMSSRLFQEVREKRGLAYTVYAMGSAYDDCGLMNIYAATSAEKGGELSAVLCDQLHQMVEEILPNEITRAKNQLKAELLMARENPQTIASWIGRHLIRYGEYRDVHNIAERIDAVTMDHIKHLGKQILEGTLTIAALGPVSGVLPYETLAKKLSA
ncbi:MAG: pitrilysin family protein [Rickettsiales bacterium]|nr:pitrilysin family protein [Rickettsiales bacterium]